LTIGQSIMTPEVGSLLESNPDFIKHGRLQVS
jgi:hypothetical protein